MKKKIKNINRRKFIKGAIATLVGFELIYVLFGLTGKKKTNIKDSELFNAGAVGGFQKDQIYTFTSSLFYLSVFEDGGMLAISIKCTHLGCMVQADANTKGFNCPCHASKFNKYGEVLSPPATRALDILPITIINGNVLVDTDKPQKRQEFNKTQLTYA